MERGSLRGLWIAAVLVVSASGLGEGGITVPTGWSTPPAGKHFRWRFPLFLDCADPARPLMYEYQASTGQDDGEFGPVVEGTFSVPVLGNTAFADAPKFVFLKGNELLLRENPQAATLTLGTVNREELAGRCESRPERGIVPVTSDAAGFTWNPRLRVALSRWVSSSLCWPKFAVGTISRRATYDFVFFDRARRAHFRATTDIFFNTKAECQKWKETWPALRKGLFPTWRPFPSDPSRAL